MRITSRNMNPPSLTTKQQTKQSKERLMEEDFRGLVGVTRGADLIGGLHALLAG